MDLKMRIKMEETTITGNLKQDRRSTEKISRGPQHPATEKE